MTENTYRLPVFETVRLAWEKVKGAKATFWVVLGLIGAAKLVEFGIGKAMHAVGNSPIVWLFMAISIALIVIQVMVSWSLIYLGVKRAFDQPIHYSMMRNTLSFSLLFKMIGLIILEIVIFSLAVTPIFLILLLSYAHMIAPDTFKVVAAMIYVFNLILIAYLTMRMYMAKLIVIVENANPWVAIKQSFKLTKCNVLRLLGLSIVNLGIVLGCLLTLGIGFIWALPYFCINAGIVYKKLQTR